MMELSVYLVRYITTFVATTCLSIIAASTDLGFSTVPTTQSPDHLTSSKNIHYDVSTMAPKDSVQSELLSVYVQTTNLPMDIDTYSEEDQKPSGPTAIVTNSLQTDSTLDLRTRPYDEGALLGMTTSIVDRTIETTSSAVSLIDLNKSEDGEMSTTKLKHTMTEIFPENQHTTTITSEHRTPIQESVSSKRRGTGASLTSSGELKSHDLEDGNKLQNDGTSTNDAPVHRREHEGYVSEATINHAALWITVAFVAVLLVYITVLIVYNAKKRDWHQSLPPYTRFVEDTTAEENGPPGTFDRILQRITGKRNAEDGYSLSF